MCIRDRVCSVWWSLRVCMPFTDDNRFDFKAVFRTNYFLCSSLIRERQCASSDFALKSNKTVTSDVGQSGDYNQNKAKQNDNSVAHKKVVRKWRNPLCVCEILSNEIINKLPTGWVTLIMVLYTESVFTSSPLSTGVHYTIAFTLCHTVWFGCRHTPSIERKYES